MGPAVTGQAAPNAEAAADLFGDSGDASGEAHAASAPAPFQSTAESTVAQEEDDFFGTPAATVALLLRDFGLETLTACDGVL